MHRCVCTLVHVFFYYVCYVAVDALLCLILQIVFVNSALYMHLSCISDYVFFNLLVYLMMCD